MCGIAGGYNLMPTGISEISQLVKKLKHRGPDGEGIFVENNAYLIHTRLSILDLSSNGKQPFVKWLNGNRIISVHNGEIYNYRQLKNDLKPNEWVYESNSDSEVLPFLYQELGLKFGEKLNGMYAYAIYDVGKQKFIVGRDLMGIKPLYYIHNKEGFHFGSEIKILVDKIDKSLINKQAIRDFISFGFINEPSTIYQEVKCVKPGYILEYDIAKNEITEIQVQTIEKYKSQTKENNFENVLEDSIKAQLISDAPIGAFLSGGVDSTIVSTVFAKFVNHPHTYHIKFNDSSRDESHIARETAKELNSKHTEIPFPTEQNIELLKKLMLHMDQPFGDMSILPTYLIATEMQKNAKVVLSGDGGDEFGCGYPRFSQLQLILNLRKILPKFLRVSISKALNKINISRKLAKLFYLSTLEKQEIIFELNSYINEEYKAELLRSEILLVTEQSKWIFKEQEKFDSVCNEMSISLYRTSLISKMLRKVDMMTMLAGIEVRVPLLDEKLVGYLMSRKCSEKVDLKTNKKLFRKYLSKILLSYTNTKKVGFDLGKNESSFINLLEIMKREILTVANQEFWKVFSESHVVKYINNGPNPKKQSVDSYNQTIVNLYSLFVWFEKSNQDN